MGKTVEEEIAKLKEIIWKCNNITSYKLMAEYIKQGGEYDNPCKFEQLLKSLRAQSDIVYAEEEDKYKLYKKIALDGWVDNFRIRCNCYDCKFRIEIDGRDWDEKIACALNPFIHPRNNMDGLRRCECPINTILKSMQNEEVKQ